MDADPHNEMLRMQRAVKIVWWMKEGETFTDSEIAEMFHLDRRTAHRMMCLISQTVPIYMHSGRWTVCARREEQ